VNYYSNWNQIYFVSNGVITTPIKSQDYESSNYQFQQNSETILDVINRLEPESFPDFFVEGSGEIGAEGRENQFSVTIRKQGKNKQLLGNLIQIARAIATSEIAAACNI